MNTNIRILALLFLAGFGISRQAAGQEFFSPIGLGYTANFGGGMFNWGGGYGGGTPEGNYLMGMSSVIGATGAYNEALSRSYINYEEARTRYIENQRRWTDAYFAIREANQAQRAEARERARHSPEVLAAAARSMRPRPLSSESLDPTTGRLLWPEVLQADQYASLRTRIEQLLEVYVSTGSGDTVAIQRATREMIELLKSNIRELPAYEYIIARRFLDSLAWTARVS